jgi:hypothetical protein
VAFASPKPNAATPTHPPARAAGETASGVKPAPASPDWLGLQHGLESQRARVGRIRVPSREEMLQRIGENHPAAWQADILWSRVCYTWQPELTEAWFACVAAFRQESRLDRVFQQCLFWVVTRSLQCFY